MNVKMVPLGHLDQAPLPMGERRLIPGAHDKCAFPQTTECIMVVFIRINNS